MKEKIAKIFIPKNTPYCHYEFKKSKKYGVCAYPCVFWTKKYNKEWGCEEEYCRYLGEFLNIQDQVKDCEINED